MGGFVAVQLATRHPGAGREPGARRRRLPDGHPAGAHPRRPSRPCSPTGSAGSAAPGRRSTSTSTTSAHTAPLLDRDDPLLRTYLEHDLRDGRVRLSADALVADATSVFFGDVPWRDVGAPVRFLHAEWGTGRDSAPAYPPEAVERYAAVAQTVVGVEGVDHAGAIMSPRAVHCRPPRAPDEAMLRLAVTLLEALGRELPEDRLVVDADVVASLSDDEAEWAPVGKARGRAAGPHRGRGRARGAGLRRPRRPGRAARRRHRPVRRRQRRRRLRRPRPVADDRGHGDRPRQPGLRGAARRRQQRPQGGVAEHGLWYPPDPASAPWSTIGGNVATNAGGLCCLKYGVTRDYVLGLRAVVGGPAGYGNAVTGSAGVRRKGVAGYDIAGADGRLRGHPRRRHRGDAAAAARPGRHAAHRRRRLPQPGRRRARPSPR